MWNDEGEDVPAGADFSTTKRLYTTKELVGLVDRSLANYYGMVNSSNDFEDYRLSHYAEMYVINITRDESADSSQTIVPTNGSIIHPLTNSSNTELRAWVQNLKELQLRYIQIIVEFPADSQRDVTCYAWNVNQRFYHMESGQIRVELDMTPNTCDSFSGPSTYWWLNSMVVVLALLSFLLELHHILETVGTL